MGMNRLFYYIDFAGLGDGRQNNKMQFGGLSSRQAIDRRFKEMRAQSRQELLSQIYGKSQIKGSEESIEADLASAFSAILDHHDFEKDNQTVAQIGRLFNINLESLKKMERKQREKTVLAMITAQVEEKLRIIEKARGEQARKTAYQQSEQGNHFEWLGLKSKYANLRPIFEEILLEKVKMFDSELMRLTDYTDHLPYSTIEIPTTAREGLQTSKFSGRSKTIQVSERQQRVQSEIAQGFCNVKIRDKSQFLLSKWSSKEQLQFQQKKGEFRSNLKINNIPVLFQFVKKYTKTVKARDNIYRKWEQREKTGITPEEVRYLCATSLFLNNSLAKSEKRRIKNNLQAVGADLVSSLETNIAEKIIETYHQLMKRVSDLRAKYYEDLTQMRKKQQTKAAVTCEGDALRAKKKEAFLKYKAMFTKIINSERMRWRLNEGCYKWVRLFIDNLKRKIGKPLRQPADREVFGRLSKAQSAVYLQLKSKFPSSKIIKREDQYSHRLKYRSYLPSQRFQYEPKFEDSISRLNKIKLDMRHKANYHKQISGGPKAQEKSIFVDLSKKQAYLSSPSLIKYIILIQAKWKSIFQSKKFAIILEEHKQQKAVKFQLQQQSLKMIYPLGKKIDLKGIENRLRRVNMKISNILKPYIRVAKRPINTLTAFTSAKLSAAQLRNKYARSGKIRLGEFLRLVENNQYNILKKSGIVITNRQINDCLIGRGANAMWWSVYHSNLELSLTFLEGGGDPNSKDSEGDTCLHTAVKNGDLQIVFLLLDYGADLNRKNNKKITCLFHATKKMLKLLGLEEGSVLGDKDNNSLFYRKTFNEDFYPEHYY